jgi:hypothetical protein
MRRLAKHSRNDRVLSKRDYQTITDRQGVSFTIRGGAGGRLVFCANVHKPAPVSPFAAVGGYVRSNAGTVLAASLKINDSTRDAKFRSGSKWGRFGFVVPAQKGGTAHFTVIVPKGVKAVEFWGLDCGALKLPPGVVAAGAVTAEVLDSPHLAPETYYLPHADAVSMDLEEDRWECIRGAGAPGAVIHVKKCAYCQRYLPIDRGRASALAFHKHNAKATGHQNECRACKKWRINNSFNPKRTTDQLHESSVITRERKLFLREPEILARVKDRQGDGLKSIIWRRFGKACFRCETPLKLSQVELDHTRPMAYLWPIDEHATCLCATCNNFKKDRFPVDVYSQHELRRLAAITGLRYMELVKKEVNSRELRRITRDTVTYAREWDPRTFNATARKIKELRPRLDLFALLKRADAGLYRQICSRLDNRPEWEED